MDGEVLHAYVNGEFVPEDEAKVSVFDRAFRSGDHVYEVQRTFNGRLHGLDGHMRRLFKALHYTRIDPRLTPEELGTATAKLVEHNARVAGPDLDLVSCQIITRGNTKNLLSGPPTVIIYTQLLDMSTLARTYLLGKRLITPGVQRVPAAALTPRVKIANKMSLMLAWLEVMALDPEAQALVLDQHGNVTTCAPGSGFLFATDGVIHVPNRRNTLDSSAMGFTLELAARLGIEIREGDYTTFDVYSADEAFTTNTKDCIVPVSTLNGLAIGTGRPGPMYRRLVTAWSEAVGVDIVGRAVGLLPAAEREALLESARSTQAMEES
ncbi:aminotransferase class IV [Dactylosporangium sp. CA-092794]|uniref:aminotransferase class IV n=1 Tax=Dactylosporangium sp. CA-092794 TaxID=3239929 RepID=UPI003D8D4EB0